MSHHNQQHHQAQPPLPDDADSLMTILLHILPLGSRSSTAFINKQVQVDVVTTSIQQIKSVAKVAPSSLVLHAGVILDNETNIGSVIIDENERKQKRLRQLHHHEEQEDTNNNNNNTNQPSTNNNNSNNKTSLLEDGKTLPYLVIISCASRFYETTEWSSNPNTMARLLNAGVTAECALSAGSRSAWQRGFPEFFSAAQVLWKMMDTAGKHASSYQRRIESACLSPTSHRLQPVLPFNEFDGRMMLPPVLMQGLPHERFIDEWVCDTNARDGFSRDEIKTQEDRAKHVRALRGDFEKMEPMVVRVYGYHTPMSSSGNSNNNHNNGSSTAANSNINTGRSNNHYHHGNNNNQQRTTSASASFSATPRDHTSSFGLSNTVQSVFSNQNMTNNIHNGGANQQQQQQAQHVSPFTAFFVSRSLLLTTRTAAYSSFSGGTFASSFKFTRRLRALHGMLEEHVDLHQLRVVEGVAEALAERINHLGINVENSSIPPGLAATEWCDLMLLEIVDPSQYASVGEYFLPELNPMGFSSLSSAASNNNNTNTGNGGAADSGNNSTAPGGADDTVNNTIFCMSYPSAPDSDWMEQVFGPRGYNSSIGEDTIRKLFWGYDLKTTSVGEIMIHSLDEMERTRSIYHNCSVLPGSRGAPLLKNIKKTVISSHDASKETLYLFAGIERGRSTDEMQTQREDIIALSTSEIARRDSLAYNIRNEAHASNHLSLVLLYQTFIANDIASNHPEHRKYIQQYLSPYEIFTSHGLLSTCHRLMLKDADDFNEYGVDFYEHKDLQNALYCFREGAKMFSTAMIPNLQDYELELRTALQTNVTSVVVALKFSDGTGGAA